MRSYWLLTALAAFTGSCEMGAFNFIDSVGNKIPVAQQPTQTVRLFLQAGATDANVGNAFWSTDDRRVLPVEIRIALAGWNAGIPPNTLLAMRDPLLSYSLEYGVGSTTVAAPNCAPQSASASAVRVAGYAIPARGAVTRVLARDVIVRLRFNGHHDNPVTPVDTVFEWVDVSVSFTPCDDLTIAAPPSAAYYSGWTKPYQPFPPEAREFRLVNLVGLPYAANFSRDVAFRTAIGGYLRSKTLHDMTFDRAAFGDWTPISPRVAGWEIGAGLGNWDVEIPEVPLDDTGPHVIALYR